jgi:putative tryptophan/tyrosine transport system substrate-binding protein
MPVTIGRRKLIAALGGVVAWPLAARGQQASKLPTIGYLGDNAANWSPWTTRFVERLRELGWSEGQTIAIEYRWSEGRPERVTEIAAEFARRNVNVIVTYGGAVAGLKQATAAIPIVFAIAVDPIGSGIVTSLSHPGGNVTGLSVEQTDIAGKRLQLLREVVPGVRRLAVMFDAGYPAAARENDETQAAARTLGLDVVPRGIRRAEDIGPAFEAFQAQADALYVAVDAVVNANREQIAKSALSARLPTTFNESGCVQAGGLMSYGPNFPALFRRAAELVDKILRGTNPGDIPVEQPTKFELAINLTTAKALALTVPPSLLALADEVLE